MKAQIEDMGLDREVAFIMVEMFTVEYETENGQIVIGEEQLGNTALPLIAQHDGDSPSIWYYDYPESTWYADQTEEEGYATFILDPKNKEVWRKAWHAINMSTSTDARQELIDAIVEIANRYPALHSPTLPQ